MIPFKHIEMFKDRAYVVLCYLVEKELVYPKDENGKYDYNVWNSEGFQRDKTIYIRW